MNPRNPWRRSMMVIGSAFLVVTRLVLADPAPSVSPTCEAASPTEAKSLADRLYDQQEYQRAGACYEAAGDPWGAQTAFMKAVGPKSAAAAREIRAQGDAAKALIAKLQHPFRRDR